jgi:hypothetical protein
VTDKPIDAVAAATKTTISHIRLMIHPSAQPTPIRSNAAPRYPVSGGFRASLEISVVIPDISVPELIRFAPDLLHKSAGAVVTFWSRPAKPRFR